MSACMVCLDRSDPQSPNDHEGSRPSLAPVPAGPVPAGPVSVGRAADGPEPAANWVNSAAKRSTMVRAASNPRSCTSRTRRAASAASAANASRLVSLMPSPIRCVPTSTPHRLGRQLARSGGSLHASGVETVVGPVACEDEIVEPAPPRLQAILIGAGQRLHVTVGGVDVGPPVLRLQSFRSDGRRGRRRCPVAEQTPAKGTFLHGVRPQRRHVSSRKVRARSSTPRRASPTSGAAPVGTGVSRTLQK